MTTITTNALVEKLRNGTVEVEFTKANGETRVMRASLAPEVVTSEEAANAVRGDVVSVMDTSLNQWRSIPVSRITRVGA